MQWFTRAASQASVMAGIALALGYYLAGAHRWLAAHPAARRRHAALTWVNVRGHPPSAWLVNALTMGKLLPLILFIVIGLRYVKPTALTDAAPGDASAVLGGGAADDFRVRRYDVVPVPAGEALDPRRHVPFALVLTILTVWRDDARAGRRAGCAAGICRRTAPPLLMRRRCFWGRAGRCSSASVP